MSGRKLRYYNRIVIHSSYSKFVLFSNVRTCTLDCSHLNIITFQIVYFFEKIHIHVNKTIIKCYRGWCCIQTGPAAAGEFLLF